MFMFLNVYKEIIMVELCNERFYLGLTGSHVKCKRSFYKGENEQRR